jgi:hypothetical protein
MNEELELPRKGACHPLYSSYKESLLTLASKAVVCTLGCGFPSPPKMAKLTIILTYEYEYEYVHT